MRVAVEPGEGRRGARLRQRRQHRRADGDLALRAEDHAGIDRPAIATVLPNTKGGYTYVLDLGANVDCTPEQLLQFGVMGAMLVAAVEHKERPIGRPAQHRRRGHQGQRNGEAARRELLRASGLNFTATSKATTSTRAPPTSWSATASSATSLLKASEGVAKMIVGFLREEFTRNAAGTCSRRWWRCRCSRRFARAWIPAQYNGASLLGLKRHRHQEPRLGRRVRLRPARSSARVEEVAQRACRSASQQRMAQMPLRCPRARRNDLLRASPAPAATCRRAS